MADLTRTYTGPSGRLRLPTRTIPVLDGQPVEVTADEAALLDLLPEWSGKPAQKRKRATPADPKPTQTPSQGDEPDSQEPTP